MAPSPSPSSTSSPSASVSASTQLRLLRPRSPTASSPTFTAHLSLLDRLATALNSTFHSLGLLLSSHQIPSLLLCAIVICSLIAPSLTPFLTITSTSTRTSLQQSWNAEGLKRQGLIPSEDQVCWERLGEYYEVREVQARVVRVEQVLISSAGAGGRGRGGGGALTKETLHRAWLVQSELERRLRGGEVEGVTCVKEEGGGCAVGSPLSWWRSEEGLLRDGDVHATLSLPAPGVNGEEKGMVPLTSSSTLVGIGRDRQGLVKGAHHLAITFYLLSNNTPANASSAHPGGGGGLGLDLGESARMKQNWRKAVREVVDGNGWGDDDGRGKQTQRDKMGKVTEARGKGRRVILKHLPHLTPVPHPRLLESFLFFLGYLLVILYIHRNLSLLGPHVVNSMPGLLLTGVVQLTLSGVMSLSVVGLLGWDTGLVPWNLMAFLVLVCGVDNMLVLTHAVSLTDIRLPIPQRLAAGLQAVGLSSTVTLVTELVGAGALLLVIDVQVIRQLIVFAAVVLVVDYFLEMTFFATILSIDIQRLELADLLTQGHKTLHRHFPSTPSDLDDGELLDHEMEGTSTTTRQHFFSVLEATKSVLRDRAARTTTFGFLFLIDSLLYLAYGPDHFLPAFCSETALSPHNRPFLSPSLSSEISRSLQRGQRSSSPSTSYPAEQIAPRAAANFWHLLNPNNLSSAVHLQLEPVTAVQLFDVDGALAAPESLLLGAGAGAGGAGGGIVEQAWWSRVGMILLPIAGTIAILYVLLLYLLKDAELLEGERERKEKERGEKRKVREGAGVEGRRLEGGWKGDVELVASGREAVVSWAGLDDRVVLWRRRKGANTTSNTTFDPPIPLEIPLAADPPSLTLLAIDPTSRFCAAATTAGRILIWSLERQLLIDFSPMEEGEEETTATKIGRPVALFAGPEGEKGGVVGPPSSRGAGGGGKKEEARFCSVHLSGVVVVWDCVACTSTVVFRPPPTTISSPPSPNSTPPLPPPSPSRPVPKTKTTIIIPSPHLSIGAPSWPIYARHSSNGRLALYRADPATPHRLWTLIFDEQVTTEVDPVTALACGEVELGGADGSAGRRGILVVGTLEGIVSLYSLPLSGESPSTSTAPAFSTRLATLSDLSSPIRQLRLAPTTRRTSSPSSTPSSSTTSEKCPTCTQLLHEGFLVILSSKENLQVLRVSLGGGGGSSGGGAGKGCMCPPRGMGGGGGATRQRSESLGLGMGVARTTPKKGRRASHGRVTNGGVGGEEMMNGTGNEGGARRERESSEGSQATPTRTPLRTPVTPTFKIDQPEPLLSDDTSSLRNSPLPTSTDVFSVPLFDTSTSDDSFLPSTLPSSTADQLQVHELFSTYTDERGGWELVGDRIVGVRRTKRGSALLAEANGGLGGGRGSGRWEMWSVELIMGAVIGQSELENLLRVAPTVGAAATSADSSLDDPSSSSLRRRHQVSTTPSSRRLLETPSSSASPSIRFQQPLDLPFSRARPLVAALDSTAIAVGLGNQLVLFSLRQVAGRRGGLLALPRGRGVREGKKGL